MNFFKNISLLIILWLSCYNGRASFVLLLIFLAIYYGELLN